MDWQEACDLVRGLLLDSSAHITAAIAGWSRPASPSEMAVLDLFDLMALVNSKTKPSPHPRPSDPPKKKRTSQPASVVIEALRKRGHGPPTHLRG